MQKNTSNKIPKIAILGYGAMGKEIEKAAEKKKLIITDIFDIDNKIDSKSNYDFDVAIDFTYPDAVLTNVEILSKLNKNIVIGTTGWQNIKIAIEAIVERAGIGIVYASNFSIGMQMYFRIVELAAQLKNNISDYDIFMNEIHHIRKKDSPSGTALRLAELILENVSTKNEILTDKSKGEISSNKLHLSSTRGGEITGTHTVYLDSEADTIELTHRAKNRSGFASGAIEAAIWVNQKKGFYDFSAVINNMMNL